MKKLIVAAMLLAVPFAVGCSDPCGDYEDEVNDCCAKAPSGVSCDVSVDADADDDACEAASDAFVCPF